MTTTANKADFFISYTKDDSEWAEWVAAVLEQNNYQVIAQFLDFRVSRNFVLDMDSALAASHRLMILLSPAYMASGFTAAEWSAVFRNDPTGAKGLIIPIKIKKFDVTGLLGPRVHIPLYDLDELAARARLLDGLREPRATRNPNPPFPGTS